MNGILIFNPISKKLLPWTVLLFLGSFPLLLLIFLFAIAPFARLNHLPLTDYIINLTWLGLCGAFCIGETGTQVLGKESVHVFHSQLVLDKGWEKRSLPPKFKEPFNTVGIFLYLHVSLVAIGPYFLLFGLYFEMDPVIMLYKYWIPSHLTNQAYSSSVSIASDYFK